jgi:hypothetical protein
LTDELNFMGGKNDVEGDLLAGLTATVVRRPGRPCSLAELSELASEAGVEVELNLDFPDVYLLRGGLDPELVARVLGEGCAVAHEVGSLDLPWVPGSWIRGVLAR